MRFRFDPLSRAFLNRCAFSENTQRIIVSVMIYYHNHSCKSVHDPSFTEVKNDHYKTTQISNSHTQG